MACHFTSRYIIHITKKPKRTGVSESDLSCECLETLSELADVGNILGLSHPTLENYLVSHY